MRSVGVVVLVVVLSAGIAWGAEPVKGLISSTLSSGEWLRENAAPFEWTAEEMAKAIPYPIDRVAAGNPHLPRAFQGGHGVSGFIPGNLPDGERVSTLDGAGTVYSSGTTTLGYSYPGPYTRYENFPSTSAYPYKTIGRLFFQQYGVSYACSAASIGNYAIWTAGHCVHAGDGSDLGWSTNLKFVPGFRDGKAPFGSFTGIGVITIGSWYSSGDLGTDFGGVILKPVKGKKIGSKVGALGFAWNQDLDTHWFVFGYPAAPPFDGRRQIACAASYAYSDATYVPNPSAIGCDQTGGASGGPWILGLSSSTSGNYLNGNVSYRRMNFPEEIFTPYFDDLSKSLHDCLVASTPSVPAC